MLLLIFSVIIKRIGGDDVKEVISVGLKPTTFRTGI